MSEIEVNSMFVNHGRFAVRALRMQRSLRIFIVPELYWVLLYLGVRWLATR